MAKYKVVITDHEYESIENERQALAGLDAELLDYQYKDMENILRVAKDADALIVQNAKMTRELIEQLDKCKIITRYATGYDGIDLEACTERGIYVCNVSEYCSEEVSTYAAALLLEMVTRVSKRNAWTHQGNWFGMPDKQHSLKQQVVGVVSFGRIATLTEKTHHLIDREALTRMKKSAVLINVARGPVVSEKDLIWALENGEIAGAALDVLEQEPPAKDSPLFQFDNVIVSPHSAWYSEESQARLQRTVGEDVARVLKGELPLNLVNKEVLDKK